MGPLPRAVRHHLTHLVDSAELAALREVAGDASRVGWTFAMSALGLRDDPAGLPAAAELLRVDESGAMRAAAYRNVTALSAIIALPLARQWWDLPDGRGSAAASIMGRYAEPNDEPAIRASLTQAVDVYTMCSLIDGLGRLPTRGPFAELDLIYQGVGYSYARSRAVRAMAATDPDFGSRAEECLWDCEQEIVEVGVVHAAPTRAAAERVASPAHPAGSSSPVRVDARHVHAPSGMTPPSVSGDLFPRRTQAM